jgi:hypothetical protein
MPPFNVEEVRAMLMEQGVQADEAGFLARKTNGNLSEAKRGLDEGWYPKRKEWMMQLHRGPIMFLDQFHAVKSDEALQVFDFLTEWTRDLMVLFGSGDSLVIHNEFKYPMSELAKKHSFARLSETFESITLLRKSIEENANVKLVFTQAQILLSKIV